MQAFYEEQPAFANHTLFVADTGESATYQEWSKVASKFQGVMQERKSVLCFASNTPGALLGYLSFLRNRIVPIMISSEMQMEFVQELMELYDPEYLYLPSTLAKEYTSNPPLLHCYDYALIKATTNHIATLDSDPAHCQSTATKVTTLDSDPAHCQSTTTKATTLDSQSAPCQASLHPDLALCLTTSGSTGSPKLVRQSYVNLTSNAESIATYLKLDASERPITTLPMHYTYGLSIIHSHVAVGATILLTEKSMMQKEFWAFLKEMEATSFGGVPYHYEMLERLRFFQMDLPSLRTMTQAGGKLSQELHRAYAKFAKEHHKRFVVMYGQCEATARMAYLPVDKSCEKCGSVGVAIPGGRFSLKDAKGQEIEEANVTGELIYRGKNVAMGYAKCAKDLEKGDEWNGILQTGDMARRDEDGFYYIVGRKKRFLKVYGNRVNLDEVEMLLKQKFHPLDCACAGVDDQIYIFLTDDTLQQQVRSYASQMTHLNRNAFAVRRIDEIPKNDAGKVLYAQLETHYGR